MHLDPHDEERLSAYLDGELSAEEQARVEQLLADEPAARQLLEELRVVSNTLQSLPRTRVPGDLAADVLREIERRGVRRAKQNSDGSPSAVMPAASVPVVTPALRADRRDEPASWRQRIVRPLVYVGIAVAVFAAVSLVTEPAGEGPLPVARHLEERERGATEDLVEGGRVGGEVWDATPDDRDRDVLAKDGQRRSRLNKHADESAPPQEIVSNEAAGAAGMNLSKPGPMPAQTAGQAADVAAGAQAPVQQFADPRAFYYQQAIANQEPVLVVQCRVTPEAARQDLVGKLLVKNSVAIDDEAAAALDTAINANFATPLAAQQAMPAAEQSLNEAAAETASPPAAPPLAAESSTRLHERNDDVPRVAKQAATADNDDPFDEPNDEPAATAEPASDTTVYLVDASPEQLAGVLSDLNSQTDGVLSVTVTPAPEAPSQSDYLNYNRAAPPATSGESESDDANQPAQPSAEEPSVDELAAPAAPPAATAQSASPAAADGATEQAAEQGAEQSIMGRRVPPRVAKAEEVRLQVQALGVLEQEMENTPAQRDKFDRFSNSSRARKLRQHTLSNLAPPGPDGAAYANQGALFGQANSAPAPLAPNRAPEPGAPRFSPAQPGAAPAVAQEAAPAAPASQMANTRKAGPRAAQALQRAVILLEVESPRPQKKG
ncbi:MAG: zf-HC2 domain-containing protein [Pirellulales bacterium]|nr:zf-HC2 domain-containing protein [Pirellulales bacterium]